MSRPTTRASQLSTDTTTRPNAASAAAYRPMIKTSSPLRPARSPTLWATRASPRGALRPVLSNGSSDSTSPNLGSLRESILRRCGRLTLDLCGALFHPYLGLRFLYERSCDAPAVEVPGAAPAAA